MKVDILPPNPLPTVVVDERGGLLADLGKGTPDALSSPIPRPGRASILAERVIV